MFEAKKRAHCKSLTYNVLSVPRAGIEPARLAALVFETNASTNSAIWAGREFCVVRGVTRNFAGAKIQHLIDNQKRMVKKTMVCA